MIRTYDLKVPPLPRKRPAWLASTRAWWASVWHSPMAAEYLDVDRFALERLARLIDEGGRRPLKVGELAAIVSLEDRFGLTPRSRRMLGWAVLDAADVATREPPVVGRGSNVRRLARLIPATPGRCLRGSPNALLCRARVSTCEDCAVPRLRTLAIAAVIVVMTDVTWDGESLHLSFGLPGRKRLVQFVIP